MTFSPTGPPYIPPGSPGSYVSTTPDLDAFCSNPVDIDCIEATTLDANMVQLLYLALIFDFMAFTAQTVRRVLGRKPSSLSNLQAIKDIMIENLSTMKAHFVNDTMTVTLDIFKAIVLDSEPTPSERRPRRSSPLLPRVRTLPLPSILDTRHILRRPRVLPPLIIPTRQHQPRQTMKSPLSVLPIALIRQ